MTGSTREQKLHSQVKEFMTSRRSETARRNALKIIQLLEEARKNIPVGKMKEEIGLVRAKDLIDELVGHDKEIKYVTTLFRLLKELERLGIIEKISQSLPHERGRPAIYYRTVPEIRERWFMSLDQAEQFYGKQFDELTDLRLQMLIAQDLLIECKCLKPGERIVDRFKKRWGRTPALSVIRDITMEKGTQKMSQIADKAGRIVGIEYRHGPDLRKTSG